MNAPDAQKAVGIPGDRDGKGVSTKGLHFGEDAILPREARYVTLEAGKIRRLFSLLVVLSSLTKIIK